MNATGWSRGLDVTGGGTGVVSHAGLALLRQLSDRAGLTAGLSAVAVGQLIWSSGQDLALAALRIRQHAARSRRSPRSPSARRPGRGCSPREWTTQPPMSAPTTSSGKVRRQAKVEVGIAAGDDSLMADWRRPVGQADAHQVTPVDLERDVRAGMHRPPGLRRHPASICWLYRLDSPTSIPCRTEPPTCSGAGSSSCALPHESPSTNGTQLTYRSRLGPLNATGSPVCTSGSDKTFRLPTKPRSCRVKSAIFSAGRGNMPPSTSASASGCGVTGTHSHPGQKYPSAHHSRPGSAGSAYHSTSPGNRDTVASWPGPGLPRPCRRAPRSRQL